MSDVTVKQLKEAKRDLEEQIASLLDGFARTYGARDININLSKHPVMAGPPKIIVEVEVRL